MCDALVPRGQDAERCRIGLQLGFGHEESTEIGGRGGEVRTGRELEQRPWLALSKCTFETRPAVCIAVVRARAREARAVR
jgi:hypothetical protein